MIFQIPIVARDKHIYYAAVIAAEKVLLKGQMGDFFERRYEGYHECFRDLYPDASGLLVCDHDAALEEFLEEPQKAARFLAEHHPTDFTTKRLQLGDAA